MTLLPSSTSPPAHHLLHLHAVFKDDDYLHLVVDLCPGPDFFSRGSFTEPEAAAVMAPFVQALAHCHRLRVAHRYVKLENVLFDACGRIEVADLGSTELLGQPMVVVVGTPYDVAPRTSMDHKLWGHRFSCRSHLTTDCC